MNRLSIGLQSVNDEELRLLGRIHTYEEFPGSISSGEANGFSNINVDLISAIPGADGGKLEAYTGAGNGTFPGAYFCI